MIKAEALPEYLVVVEREIVIPLSIVVQPVGWLLFQDSKSPFVNAAALIEAIIIINAEMM
ncbi:hypothetical protein GCM10007877_37650 [Marinibactrum halimedae]|uniref:Uncharacterized protein n=1 Tax=Marinibactrum halimedae TaxID=1444977 RepID=A0AA37TCU6_9GAMM|nr:hypothetical protein GCM10007877_37650 [Marinibactrum halimedae]